MNLPNLLTLVRIFLVPLLVAALVQQNWRIQFGGKVLIGNGLLALTFFLAAAVTDLLDGYLARRWKQVTTVGTLLDPVADKLLVSAALVSFRADPFAAGMDGDPDYQPGVCGIRTAEHRRGGRLHHQSG